MYHPLQCLDYLLQCLDHPALGSLDYSALGGLDHSAQRIGSLLGCQESGQNDQKVTKWPSWRLVRDRINKNIQE